jgi:hypothetical protein
MQKGHHEGHHELRSPPLYSPSKLRPAVQNLTEKFQNTMSCMSTTKWGQRLCAGLWFNRVRLGTCYGTDKIEIYVHDVENTKCATLGKGITYRIQARAEEGLMLWESACQILDFPVNTSSSMPAARNCNFTLVAEFLALQAICQCPL